MDELRALLDDWHRCQAAAARGDATSLTELLDHPSLTLRHASHVELLALSGGDGRAFGYDPFAAPTARAAAIAAWRQSVADGHAAGPGRVRRTGAASPAEADEPPPDPRRAATHAVRLLDLLIAESRRPEAVDELIRFLDADPETARLALGCLRQRTGAPAQLDIPGFRAWWAAHRQVAGAPLEM